MKLTGILAAFVFTACGDATEWSSPDDSNPAPDVVFAQLADTGADATPQPDAQTDAAPDARPDVVVQPDVHDAATAPDVVQPDVQQTGCGGLDEPCCGPAECYDGGWNTSVCERSCGAGLICGAGGNFCRPCGAVGVTCCGLVLGVEPGAPIVPGTCDTGTCNQQRGMCE